MLVILLEKDILDNLKNMDLYTISINLIKNMLVNKTYDIDGK